MSTIHRLPQNIKAILKTMQEVAPCIIAGGAIRDTLNGRWVKDVDVFMDVAHEREFRNTFRSTHGTTRSWEQMAALNTGYRLANVVTNVYEDKRTFDLPVQVVFTSIPPEEYVDKYFDFGICKAWYDGAHIRCHKDYNKDVNNKTITMCIDDQTMARAYSNRQYALTALQAHSLRIKKKYSDWRVVMPSV